MSVVIGQPQTFTPEQLAAYVAANSVVPRKIRGIYNFTGFPLIVENNAGVISNPFNTSFFMDLSALISSVFINVKQQFAGQYAVYGLDRTNNFIVLNLPIIGQNAGDLLLHLTATLINTDNLYFIVPYHNPL
jgi:hypothetical protein